MLIRQLAQLPERKIGIPVRLNLIHQLLKRIRVHFRIDIQEKQAGRFAKLCAKVVARAESQIFPAAFNFKRAENIPIGKLCFPELFNRIVRGRIIHNVHADAAQVSLRSGERPETRLNPFFRVVRYKYDVQFQHLASPAFIRVHTRHTPSVYRRTSSPVHGPARPRDCTCCESAAGCG